MAKVLPFSGVIYNPEKFNNLDGLVVPSYNLISSSLRKKLMEDLNNFSHLVFPFGSEQEKYKNVVNRFFGWLLRDILVIDKSPSYYAVQIETKENGISKKCVGFYGLLKIEDQFSLNFPETVDESLVMDKYNLLKESQAIFEPVCFMYRDQSKFIESKIEEAIKALVPLFEVNAFKNSYRVYKIKDEQLTKDIKEYFEKANLYVAGGQSILSASLKYREEMKNIRGEKFSGQEPFNFVFSVFFNYFNETVQLVPVQRGIKKIDLSVNDIMKSIAANYKFGVIQFNDAREEVLAKRKLKIFIEENRKKNILSFGFYHRSFPSRYFIFTYKTPVNEFDINLLNKSILDVLRINPLDNSVVEYVYNYDELFEMVKNGEFTAGFIVDGVNKSRIFELSERKISLPPLSFSFYPLLISGILLYSFRYSVYTQ
jgi:uncharacterized protein (DUF1015 family)